MYIPFNLAVPDRATEASAELQVPRKESLALHIISREQPGLIHIVRSMALSKSQTQWSAAMMGTAIGLGVAKGCLGNVQTPTTAYQVLQDSGKFTSYLSFALRFGEP